MANKYSTKLHGKPNIQIWSNLIKFDQNRGVWLIQKTKHVY